MATIYADNYKKAYVNRPAEKIPTGEVSGEIKFAYDEITFTGEVTAADVIKTALRVTKGAKVIAAGIFVPVGLGAGSFSLGRPASAQTAADPDSLIAATSFASAGIARESAASVDLLLDIVEDELIFELACTVTTTTATGKKLKVWIQWCDV